MIVKTLNDKYIIEYHLVQVKALYKKKKIFVEMQGKTKMNLIYSYQFSADIDIASMTFLKLLLPSYFRNISTNLHINNFN